MPKKEKPKKSPPRKPKYNTLSCVAYVYRLLWKYQRPLVFAGIFTVPVGIILSALGLYTPSIILSTLETADTFSYAALVIAGLLLTRLLLDLGNTVIGNMISYASNHVFYRLMYMIHEKKRDMDFYLSLDPNIQVLSQRAGNTLGNGHSAGIHFPMDFSNMLLQVLNFILFGSVISMLNPVIILLLALGCFLNSFMGRWEQKQNYRDEDERNRVGTKVVYHSMNVSQNFKYAKDVRLFSMQKSMHDRLEGLYGQRVIQEKRKENRGLLSSLEYFLFILIRDGAAYAFLILQAARGEVDASQFVLYFSAIASMSGLMGGILGTFNWVHEGAMQISDFREYMEIPDKLNRGKGIPVPAKPFSIEFKNVSYKYPQGEKKVLDNISFKINAGEKLALVGLNGAGKTTLTKMMCGLLLPDEGEVLLDGHPLTDYNRDEMYSLFGLVPQDYHLLPVSIARNIASAMTDDEIDRDRLNYCIEQSGLSEKISSLPKGVDTPLNRELNPDGIELSGGETQKLLLARLIYKNPHCIILDEPTAALDPIAEDKMYRKYNEIAAHATSIFISHRLASTRFADRIFLLDGAKIAEVGTHDELMKKGGRYRYLFDVQSKYYKENPEGKENRTND